MIYVKNLPLWERSLRIGVGTAAAAYALLSLGGVMGWVILAGGVGLALTGIFGFCPACALAGRRLEKRAQQGQK
ncbi:MAG: DUF2892 domain-containing protein [Gammaproteobacteria bacterium]|nr:DUF2892 domain-containing protein [Gammaproteobacteria bacterium]